MDNSEIKSLLQSLGERVAHDHNSFSSADKHWYCWEAPSDLSTHSLVNSFIQDFSLLGDFAQKPLAVGVDEFIEEYRAAPEALAK